MTQSGFRARWRPDDRPARRSARSSSVSIVASRYWASVREVIRRSCCSARCCFDRTAVRRSTKVHYAMILIRAHGQSMFAPPVRSRLFYAACAIGRVDLPRHSPHLGYLLALLIGLIVVAVFSCGSRFSFPVERSRAADR